MNILFHVLLAICIVSFIASALLFSWIGSRRRLLRRLVRRTEPERLPTYEQSYMSDFIRTAQSTAAPVSGSQFRAGRSAMRPPHGLSMLEYYEQAILKLDIVFSVVFAVFFISLGLAIALWQTEYVWLVYAGIISS